MADQKFLSDLRWALRHLYNPEKLRTSPLMGRLGIGYHGNPSALRRILTSAIRASAPDSSVSTDSQAYRTHYSLYHRYVDQFSQRQVAMSLGLSVRQMRRQDRLALRVLADYLLTHHDLEQGQTDQDAEPGAQPSAMAEETGPERELQWLQKAFPSEAVNVAEVIPRLVQVIAPLAQSLGVRIACSVPEDLPRLAAQLATMRQALLSALTAAIRAVPGGLVDVTAQAMGQQVCISVCPARWLDSNAPAGTTDSLDMARRLVELSGGSLDVRPGDDATHPFAATLLLPAVEQAAVLCIDDNADTLQLFQRYLAGTRYPFLGARDPQQAMALAEELSPRIILLDVMLPGIDGWELLGRLREHPKTQDAPIIVCSILQEEQLALSLGAAGFLAKPVSRTALLAALDRQLGLPSPGSP